MGMQTYEEKDLAWQRQSLRDDKATTFLRIANASVLDQVKNLDRFKENPDLVDLFLMLDKFKDAHTEGVTPAGKKTFINDILNGKSDEGKRFMADISTEISKGTLDDDSKLNLKTNKLVFDAAKLELVGKNLLDKALERHEQSYQNEQNVPPLENYEKSRKPDLHDAKNFYPLPKSLYLSIAPIIVDSLAAENAQKRQYASAQMMQAEIELT